MNVLDVLEERGYLKQMSHPDEIRELLGKEKITFYIGFDPTADSLHVGHFIALMVMAHMQRRPPSHHPVGRRYWHGGGPQRQERDAEDAHPRIHQSQYRMLQEADRPVHRPVRREGHCGQ